MSQRKMSGVTLTVASQKNPDETTTVSSAPNSQHHNRQQPAIGGVMGSLRVIELQLVAFIMVFSASGLVPPPRPSISRLSVCLSYRLTSTVFPSYGGTAAGLREIFQGNALFRFYVMVGTTISLFLPLAYVLGGFARGDEHAVRSTTPHLFLLSFQILTENVISGLSLFSPPVRALVPLLYTVRRIFVIMDWIQDGWINNALPADAQYKDVAWYWFGRALAIANLVYFSINLFGFLIPKFLPKAFDKYFREREEVQAKTAEDKRSAAANNLPTDEKES